MPNKDEELKVKEQQSESLVDSKKIDLYINNNDKDEAKGISIMNVFSRLKQRFHIYVWVMLIGLFAGLLAPTMMYTFKDKKESAVAVLGFDYANAAASQAPDGTPLDITYLKSPYIIQNALNEVTLSKEVTTAQIQSNLEITGILTDETKRQMEILDSLKEGKSEDYGKMLQEFTKQYRNQYIISLNNGFSDGRNKVKLSSEDLSHLLSAVAKSYHEYFVETYQDVELPANEVNAINVDFLDYLELLDRASSTMENLQAYCNNRAGLMAEFRSTDGLSFSDLSSMIGTLRDAKINDLQAYIYLNNVAKDRTTLLNSYQSRLFIVENQIDVVNANIATKDDAIAKAFTAQDVVVVTSTDGTSQTYYLKSAYYNQLLNERLDLLASKSALEEEKELLEYRIAILQGPEATAEQKAMVEERIADVLETSKALYKKVSDTSKELFSSNAYQYRYMHYIITYESEKLTDNLKTFILGGALGFFLAVAAWVVDAFALEFKAVKKANEAQEAEAGEAK